VFDNSIHFHPSIIFVGKANLIRREPLMGVHSNERLLASPGWKCMKVENDLAYYNTATITTIKVLKYRPLGLFDKTLRNNYALIA
jgi:hypothetical protein